MNRRKFVSDVCLISVCSIGSVIPNNKSQSLLGPESGIKKLYKNKYLNKVSTSGDLKQFLERMRGNEITSYSDVAFQYEDNYLLEVRSNRILFDNQGLLFITSDGNHLLVDEKDISILDDYITNFQLGIEQHGFKKNPVKFLFPYQINNNESAVFSYCNKYGGQINLNMKGDKSYIFIY